MLGLDLLNRVQKGFLEFIYQLYSCFSIMPKIHNLGYHRWLAKIVLITAT